VLGGGDKVRKGVLLVQVLAGLVPAAPAVAAAAHVRDAVHKAAVEQAERGAAERGVVAVLVAAVPKLLFFGVCVLGWSRCCLGVRKSSSSPSSSTSTPSQNVDICVVVVEQVLNKSW
jgi:hypothetical protein